MDRDLLSLIERIKEKPDDEASVSEAAAWAYKSGGMAAVVSSFEEVFLSLTPELRQKYIWKWLHSIINALAECQENPLLKGALKGIAAERLFKSGFDINEATNLYLEGFLDSGAENLLEKFLELIKGAEQPDLEEKILKTLILITGERTRRSKYQAALSALMNKRVEGIEELKTLLEQTDNPEVKSQLHFRIGQAILKKDISSKEGEDSLLKSFELNHKNSEAGWALAGLYTHLERYKDLEEFLTYWLGFADDAATKCEIHLKLGRLWEEVFNNPKKATAHYQMALELNPREREALSRLINLFSAAGRWNSVVEILERGLREAHDREEENIYLEELGTALYEKMKDINAAEKYFRRLRSQDPRNRKALAFYENYYQEKNDYQKLFSTLSFMLTTAEDNREKVRISLKMAEISENRLHNLDRAIEAYRRVLLIDPDNRQAEEALVVLLEKTRKWHTLVEFYNDRIRRLPDEQKDEKVAYLFKLIDIYQDTEKLPMEEMVFHTYSRIVEISPYNTIALNSLAKSLGERKRWPELLSVLKQKVAITEEPVELLELFHQISNIMIEQMSDETQAIPFLEKILEFDPQNSDISKKLKEIYRRKHNIEKLFQMNLQELSKVEGQEKEALLYELGTFAMEKLFKYEEALKYFEELYSLNPSNKKVIAIIQNLYVRLNAWERYVSFLEAHIPREMEQKPKLEMMERLGNIYLEKLRDSEKAKEVFRRIIKLFPENSHAIGVLEKIYIQEDDYPSLKELFSLRSDLRGYCALLQNELTRISDREKQVLLNVELSSVYSEQLGDRTKGMRFLESAVRAAPERTDLAERVIAYYREKGDNEKVRDLLKLTVGHIKDRTEKTRNLEELYDVEKTLNNYSGAFEALLGIVKYDLSKNSVERLQEAVALAEKTGQLNFLASELSKELDEYYSVDTLKALLKTLAEVYREKLFFYDDALLLYKRLLDIDPSDREALDFLEDIALHKRDYSELEAVYHHRIDLAKTGSESAAVYKKLAKLYEEILNDDEKAAHCFSEILRLEEWNREAASGLRRCLSRLGHYYELFELLNNSAAHERDSSERRTLLLEAARLSSSKLEDHETAANILVSLLEEDKMEMEAADLLFALFRLGVTTQSVIAALRGHYKSTERWQELINLNTILLDVINESEKPPLLYENAVIYQEKIGNASEAFDTFRELFLMNPADQEVLDRLLSAASITGRYEEAADALGKFVGVTDSRDLEVITLDDISVENRLAVKLAGIYDSNLKRTDLAIRCYEKVLPFEMDNLDLLKKLERLYDAQGMHEPLVGICLREAELSWELEERKALILKGASILEEVLNNPTEAIACYREALSLDETDLNLYARLQSVYEKEGLWEELKNLLVKKSSLYTDEKDISNIEFQTGVVFRERLNDRRNAATFFLRAFRRWQENSAALKALEDMVFDARGIASDVEKEVFSFLEKYYEEKEDYEKLLSIYKIQKELLRDPASLKEMNLKIAELQELKLGDRRGTFMTLCDSILMNPQDANLIAHAEKIAIELGMMKEFAGALFDASRNHPIPVEMALLKKASNIYLEILHDYESALNITERLIEIEPNDINTLKTLNTLFERLNRNPERVPVLETIASLVHDTEERRNLYFEMAKLSQMLGDDETAIKGYSYIVDYRPEDSAIDALSQEAIEGLVKLHEKAGNYWHLTQVLRILGEFSEDPLKSKEAYIRVAEIYDTKLDRPDEAMKVYENLHRRFPQEFEIIKDLKVYLYRLSEWERLESVLKEELSVSLPDRRLNVLIELCDNYISKLGSLNAALEILGEILSIDPSSSYVRENLKPIIQRVDLSEKAGALLKNSYIATGEFGKAVETLMMLMKVPHLKLKYREYGLELSYLLEEKLGDALAAFEIIEDLFIPEPSGDLFERYAALAAKSGNYARFCDGIESATARIKDQGERISLRLKAAEVLYGAGLHKKAEQVLRLNLSDRKGDIATIDFLERIFNESADLKGMVELLEIRLESADKSEEKIALLYSIASIYHHELRDANRAAEYYGKILEFDPIEEGAYRALENICRESGDEQGIVSILEKETKSLEELSEISEDIRARLDTLRMRLAYIYCEDPSTYEKAFDIVKKILKDRGAVESIVPVLEKIWSGGRGLFESVHLLIEIYRKMNDIEALHRVYSEGINVTHDIELKRGFLNEAEKLAEKLDNRDALFEHRKAQVAMDPSDEKLHLKLLKTAKNSAEYLDLAAFFSELFKAYCECEIVLKVGKLLGNLYAEYLSQPETAADYYRLVFLREPEEMETREALISIYTAAEKWFDLALLYEQISEIVPQNSEKLLYLFKASAIYGEKLSDREKCAEINQKVLEIDPSNTTAISELENYNRDAEDYQGLIEILKKKLAFTDKSSSKNILLEIAKIHSEKLKEYDKAAAVLKEILDMDFGYKPAFKAIEHIYADQEEFEELAKLYELRVSNATDVAEKVELLSKLAQLREFYLDDEDGAERSLREIIEIDRRNTFALSRLDELYSSREDYERLSEILSLRVEAAANRIEELSFLIRHGSVYQKLSKYRDALEIYKKILSMDPHNEDAVSSLEGLLKVREISSDVSEILYELYEKRRDYEALNRILRHQSAQQKDSAEKIGLLMKIAVNLNERLSSPHEAILALGEALQIDPLNEEVLTKLKDLAERTGQTGTAARILKETAPHVKDLSKAAEMFHYAGVLFEKMRDYINATDCLRSVLNLQPDHKPALALLTSIYSAEERYEELASVLSMRKDLEEGSKRRELRNMLAEIMISRLGEPESGLDLLKENLDEMSGDRETIQRIFELRRNLVVGLRAIDILKPVLEELGEHEMLVTLLLTETGFVSDVVRLKEIYITLGDILSEKLGRLDEACTNYGHALLISPSDPVIIEKLRNICSKLGRLRIFTDYLKEALALVHHKDEREILLKSIGYTALENLKDLTLAEESFRELNDITPGNPSILDTLETIYENGGKLKELADILERKKNLPLPTDEKKRILSRVLQIAETRGMPERIAEILEEIVSIDPDDIVTLRRLCNIYGARGETRREVFTLKRIAELSGDNAEKVGSLIKAAELIATDKKGIKEAAKMLEDALDVDPTNIGILWRLAGIYEELQDYEKLLNALEQLERITDKPGDRSAILKRIASISEYNLDNTEEAVRYLKSALDIDGKDIEILNELTRIFYKVERWRDLIEILEKRAYVSSSTSETVDCLVKAAELSLKKLEDSASAERLLRKALEINGNHVGAALLLARILEAEMKLDKALELYGRISKIGGPQAKVEALIGRGKILLKSNPEQARELLREATKIDPENETALSILRDIYSSHGYWQDLMGVLKVELRKEKESSRKGKIAFEIALCYLNKLSDENTFLEWIRNAQSFKPDDPEITQALVDYYLSKGDTSRITSQLEWLVNYFEGKKKFRELPSYAFRLGLTFLDLGETEKAAQYLKLAHEHEPYNLAISLELGRLYVKIKEFLKALRIYQPLLLKLEEIDIKYRIEVLYNLALIYFMEGEKQKALQYVQRVISLDPQHPEATALRKKIG